MAKSEKEIKEWKQFFTFEKELLAYLSEQKFLAGNKDELCYQQSEYKNSILERPPKFLHAVISLQSDEAVITKVEADIEQLKSLYIAVTNKSNFPSRFPQLLSPTPLKIYLSRHNAYRSHVVPKDDYDFIQIKRYSVGDETDQLINDIAALENSGIKTQVIEKSFGKLLNVSVNDLVSFAKAKKLTVREHSGMQFTARVRYPDSYRAAPDSYRAVRMSYSLLVVRDDCKVEESLPQGLRKHRLENMEDRRLAMPIECDAEIFIKET
jgi:hypothetical protein